MCMLVLTFSFSHLEARLRMCRKLGSKDFGFSAAVTEIYRLMSREMMDSETALPIMIPDEIHHSIADADDIEEVSDSEISVRDVCVNVLRHPLQLITRWNWKAVLLAVIV